MHTDGKKNKETQKGYKTTFVSTIIKYVCFQKLRKSPADRQIYEKHRLITMK